MTMETGVILVLLSLAVVVSSQVEPPPDKGSPSGGVMSSIFEWANSVRPFVPVDGKAAGASDEGLPPVPPSPESGPGPELGLPPEPLLPKSEQGPSNQMLPPPVHKTPQQPPKPDVPLPDLPTDLLVKDPSPAIPNMDQGFPDIQDPNQGLPGDVNLDADVIDPNLLFPSDTANAVPQKPGFENNDFLKNFLPEFPKGDKGVNINTGTSDSGSLPDASVGDPSLLGFPADKLPPKPDLPVDKPLVPDSSLPPSTGGNQPVKEPKPQSPDTVKPLLPSGTNLGRVPMDHFVPTDRTGRPISMIPINPVKSEPVPELHSAVNPALDGINGANIKDTKLVGQESNLINPNEALSKWMDIYSDGGRPESLNNVQAAHVKDIAPPTPDIAMLSHISLVNYGKDKAMRAMLREQRKQERMERRLEMRQNGNRGRGNSGNQGNPGQGRGLAMGRGRGQGWKMRRRAKRGANWPNGGGKPFQGGMQEGPLLNGVPGDPATLVDGGVPELPVTDLIKQEAAKHIQKPDLPRLKSRKEKKLRKKIKDLKQKRRKLRKLLKEGVQISDGSGADLTVTEQIQKEAAKDVGALAFPKKSKGKDKLFKEKLQHKKKKKFGKFPKFPKETIQISDGSGSDLTVTEQIKQEAGRHVGAKVFPNKLNKKEKRWQKRMNKGKKVKQDVHWSWQP